jgi:hypothetical protein
MKNVLWQVLLFFVFVFFPFCKCPNCNNCADVIASSAVIWNAHVKLVNVNVANVGTKRAGPFEVSVYADENPVASQRIQIEHGVSGLEPGASMNLKVFNFSPLAGDDNNYLGNVIAITVQVDPAGALNECDSIGKKNNEIRIRLPTSK